MKVILIAGGAIAIYLILRPSNRVTVSTKKSDPQASTNLWGGVRTSPNLAQTISGMAPGTNVSTIIASGRTTLGGHA